MQVCLAREARGYAVVPAASQLLGAIAPNNDCVAEMTPTTAGMTCHPHFNHDVGQKYSMLASAQVRQSGQARDRKGTQASQLFGAITFNIGDDVGMAPQEPAQLG